MPHAKFASNYAYDPVLEGTQSQLLVVLNM